MSQERGDNHLELEPVKVQLGVPFTVAPNFDKYYEEPDGEGISRADTIVLDIENFGFGEMHILRDQYGGRSGSQGGGVGDPIRTLVRNTKLRAVQHDGYPILTPDTAPIEVHTHIAGQPEAVLERLSLRLEFRGQEYISDEPDVTKEENPFYEDEKIPTAIFIGWNEIKGDERTPVALQIPQDPELWRDIEFVIDRKPGQEAR